MRSRHTAIFWQAADNNELGTRNRISEFLRFDPERIHPVTKERGAARLFFVKRNESYPNGVQHILRDDSTGLCFKIRPVFGYDSAWLSSAGDSQRHDVDVSVLGRNRQSVSHMSRLRRRRT